MARRTYHPAVAGDAHIACAYGCGRPAVGTLNVFWSKWTKSEKAYYRAPRNDISASVPCCAECARGNVRIEVHLPGAPVRGVVER